jgi:hypothetical protein
MCEFPSFEWLNDDFVRFQKDGSHRALHVRVATDQCWVARVRIEVYITKRRVYPVESSPSEYCASTDSFKSVSTGRI